MKKYQFANLFYFRVISHIGGTEQFLYEIAKKYHKYDIAILYDEADMDQLLRLKKLVRCIGRDPDVKYTAKRAFYNFNLDAINQIEADEHIFITHAIYQNINQIPPVNHPKLTRWIGVSKFACREIEKYGKSLDKEIKSELCYNPLTLEKPQRILKIISAGRFDDKVKGGDRIEKLIATVEKYANETGQKYLWLIFSNPGAKILTDNPNIIFMQPRIDVRDYIAEADWLVQLSDDMESYGYSINEALSYGIGVVHTPLSVISELKIPKGANLECDYDMKNADEIARKMFEPTHSFEYKPPKDEWGNFLIDEPSSYEPERPDTEVQCIAEYYDLELKKQIESNSPAYKVTPSRAKMLQGLGLVRIISHTLEKGKLYGTLSA